MAASRCCASAPRRTCARSSRKKARAPAAPGSNSQKVGDFYKSFMDEVADRVARHHAAQRRAGGDRRRSRTASDLPAAFARAAQIGVRLPFSVNVGAGPAQLRAIRRADLAVGSRHARPRLLPAQRREVRRDAQGVRDLHCQALRARQPARSGRRRGAHRRRSRPRSPKLQWDRARNRDRNATYNKMGVNVAAGLDAEFRLAGLSSRRCRPAPKDKVKDVIVRQPDYMKAIDAVIAEIPLATWKEYLTFGLISAYADGLSAPFADSALRVQRQGDWRDGSSSSRAGSAASPKSSRRSASPSARLYIERHFKQEAKARMDALIRNLLAAFKVGIDELEWMSPETKARGAGQAREVPAEDRLSRSVARLLRVRGQAGRSHRQPAALPRIPERRIVVAPRQAGGALALGLHAADRQRVVQRRPTTRSRSRPASCSRPSSTSMPTMRSTTARSAR